MSKTKRESIIETGAIIASGSYIGDSSFVGSSVSIGKNNKIGSSVVIMGHTTIGDNNTIGNNTVLGTDAQDTSGSKDGMRLEIGDNNKIGSFVLINTGTQKDKCVTKIGNDNTIDDFVHIGHDVQISNHCMIEESSIFAGHVCLSDSVFIGKKSAVHQFVKIAKFAKLNPKSALTQDLPPYCVVEGNRAKIIGLNSDKLEYEVKKDKIESAYKRLFDNNGSIAQKAKDGLRKETLSQIKDIYKFILESRRGISLKKES